MTDPSIKAQWEREARELRERWRIDEEIKRRRQERRERFEQLAREIQYKRRPVEYSRFERRDHPFAPLGLSKSAT